MKKEYYYAAARSRYDARNIPAFGHVFDFDHFTERAFTQCGQHSIYTDKIRTE